METTEILIIGAGAAGLYAAKLLSDKNKKVTVLEARNRIGGRINSIKSKNSDFILEEGAEFVHGDLPVTLRLLHESGIGFRPAGGKMVDLRKEENPILPEHWHLLEKALEELNSDITVHEFLETHFLSPAFTGLRNMIRGFVEGYDTADTHRASIFTFRDEWSNMGDEPQYRIDGGYGKLLQWMAEQVMKCGNFIHLNSIVSEIKWGMNEVIISTSDNRSFSANKILITVPLGVMLQSGNSIAHINFTPAIPEVMNSLHQIGFGEAIKIVIEFDATLIIEKNAAMQGMGFMFSETAIRTWWTQHPDKNNILTGWLTGPKALEYKLDSDEAIFDLAMRSLAEIYETRETILREKCLQYSIANWSNDPFTQGSYSYYTPQSKTAIRHLQQSVMSTLFFAGEAIYEGHSIGTVEAALESVVNAVKTILI